MKHLFVVHRRSDEGAAVRRLPPRVKEVGLAAAGLAMDEFKRVRLAADPRIFKYFQSDFCTIIRKYGLGMDLCVFEATKTFVADN